jgi:hypothetical protein
MMLIVFYTTPRRRPWLVAMLALLLGAGATLLAVSA